jgi:signal transduction histidine kinase
MQRFDLPSGVTEVNAALLQATITLGLAVLCAALYRRYHKPYFLWWAVAWGLYLLRLAAIVSFLGTRSWDWLYWHQVLTGWTGLALLWATLLFSRQIAWRWRYAPVLLFPPAWSYLAIYRLDSFMLAALPAVLFLSAVTLGTAWVFFTHARRVGSGGARLLAVGLLLWGLHHLDYPFLRARGAWNPWGYYLDILFILAVGGGILGLVLDDLRRGLAARTVELERLSRRMLQQHEEERRRLSLELHDETAQVFTAIKLQLGVLRERVGAEDAARLDRALALIDDGMVGIRSLTDDLRPSLLDDLGLVPALRSLALEFGERVDLAVDFAADSLPPLSEAAELALYRALQEALSNVARHAGARAVTVRCSAEGGGAALVVRDDGRGLAADLDFERLEREGHMGLAGMRERIVALNGTMKLARGAGPGVEVRLWLPANGVPAA